MTKWNPTEIVILLVKCTFWRQQIGHIIYNVTAGNIMDMLNNHYQTINTLLSYHWQTGQIIKTKYNKNFLAMPHPLLSWYKVFSHVSVCSLQSQMCGFIWLWQYSGSQMDIPHKSAPITRKKCMYKSFIAFIYFDAKTLFVMTFCAFGMASV